MLSILLPAIFLATLCVGACAQFVPSPAPETGVKGWGAIPVRSNTTIGTFDINVARSGNVLYGGFRYSEMSSSATNAGHVIYSKVIKELIVTGNTATIKAEGYWNRMPANITIEVLDDNPSGDWVHITAVPQGPLTIIYQAAGGLIKGDITVYGPPVQECYAKGFGFIQPSIAGNAGKFRFESVRVGNAVKGYAYYNEYSTILSAIQKPPVSIYLPAVEYLDVKGNVAVLGGVGKFNGRPAKIEIRAVDHSMLDVWPPIPDEFYIKAVPVAADAISQITFEAGGPVTRGDVAVGTVR